MAAGSATPLRTAVVVVHGMGEQLPLDTLNHFVNTALPEVGDARIYYSRPERVTDSFEARRMLAPAIAPGQAQGYGQTEFFEYHWSYLMQDNRFGDLFPILRRILLRLPQPRAVRFAGRVGAFLAVDHHGRRRRLADRPARRLPRTGPLKAIAVSTVGRCRLLGRQVAARAGQRRGDAELRRRRAISGPFAALLRGAAGDPGRHGGPPPEPARRGSLLADRRRRAQPRCLHRLRRHQLSVAADVQPARWSDP